MARVKINHVPSENIRSISYDEDTLQLFVTYKYHNRTYVYYDVEPDVAYGFETAESAGKYFNANVRGYYKYQEI